MADPFAPQDLVISPPPPSSRAPDERRQRIAAKNAKGIMRTPDTERKQLNVHFDDANQIIPAPGPEDDYVLYVALYDYTSEDPDDLQFAAGDLIQVTDAGDGPESWFEGRSQDGKEGTFPGTYVRKVRLNPAKKLEVTAEGSIVAQQPAGPPKQQQQQKLFSPPADTASSHATFQLPPAPAASAAPAESIAYYQTLYDYAGEEDDLSFKANEIIRVTDEGDGPASWMYGQSQDGREGSFPGTYVRKIKMAKKMIAVHGLEP